MKKIVHGFAIMLFASVLSGQARADTELDPDAAGNAITDYWATAEYKAQIADAVSKVPQVIFDKCATLKTLPVQVFFLDRFISGDDGNLKSGGWKETYAFSGCGNDSSLNFIFYVNHQQKIIVLAALPGESRSSAVLQHDTVADVFAAVGIHNKSTCDKVVIINTAVGKIENKQTVRVDPASVTGKEIWTEVWTVDACGQKMLVPIEFIPDALTKPDSTGTTFVVHATDIVDQ